jgi:hypothetical protein
VGARRKKPAKARWVGSRIVVSVPAHPDADRSRRRLTGLGDRQVDAATDLVLCRERISTINRSCKREISLLNP